jgi:hypothetical protein
MSWTLAEEVTEDIQFYQPGMELATIEKKKYGCA